MTPIRKLKTVVVTAALMLSSATALGQLVDKTKAPNRANEGINKSLSEQIGAGRGDLNTPGSSMFIINRDPVRAIRRGRQIFQRKSTKSAGQCPNAGDRSADVGSNIAIGAGWSNSWASSHRR